MDTHKIDYEIKLTGSKLFDIVMFNTAKKLCTEFPGLDFEYGTTSIRIFGGYSVEKYRRMSADIRRVFF